MYEHDLFLAEDQTSFLKFSEKVGPQNLAVAWGYEHLSGTLAAVTSSED
jgi:hypothetical protein